MPGSVYPAHGRNEVKAGFAQKRCPKCGGNVFLDSDSDGWYEQCLQCGHISYLETIVDAREKANQDGSLPATVSKVF